MTFMATTEAISYVGAETCLRRHRRDDLHDECRPDRGGHHPAHQGHHSVHLFGQCADMDPILALAKKHGLAVIEDGAQSQGTLYKGRKSGSMGDAGATSYYPGKNLGAGAKRGASRPMIPPSASAWSCSANTGRRRILPRRHRLERPHGWHPGRRLSVKLKYLEQSNNGRRRAAALYNQLLAGTPGLILPVEASYSRHIYHIYAVRVSQRDKLMQLLGDRGIGTGIPLSVCVHLQNAYAHLGHKRGDFPVSEACADSFLSLPMFLS